MSHTPRHGFLIRFERRGLPSEHILLMTSVASTLCVVKLQRGAARRRR
jgi:hypothetical protein